MTSPALDDWEVRGLVSRIRTAAEETRVATSEARQLQQARDELIVEAVDSGLPQRDVAAAAGISKSRIIAILGNAPPTEHV